jgi:hypothetical protein
MFSFAVLMAAVTSLVAPVEPQEEVANLSEEELLLLKKIEAEEVVEADVPVSAETTDAV